MNLALQSGVPLSLEKVISGVEEASEKVSLTQSSSLEGFAGGAALVGGCHHRQEERGGETEHPDETRGWGVSLGEVAHVRPSSGEGGVSGGRCRGHRR